ncbi:MAG: dTMP kinase [Aestuariivirgaceae bacterium]|nr:dTMP kinase [Aestuariivirgaceae bacterium]
MFITFEGGEGAGKSTQIRLLAARLEALGRSVCLTREPGGAPEAETLRELLIHGGTDRWSAEAEALLNYAARDAHLRQTIRPALARGDVVLCDRFMDSTRAYQGHAGGADFALVDALESAIVGATRPDLTLVFDLDPGLGLARAKERGGADRFERKGLAFHERLREGFRAIAAADPKRCVLLDASRSVETIATEVASIVGARL